jgi:hypothetical protein
MFGEDAIQVKDLSGIISMGQSIVGDGTQTDLFLGKLVDRIGKTVIRTLDLELEFPTLYMDSFEFGAILQKITVQPFDAIQASEYQIGDNGFTPTYDTVMKNAKVLVRYFTDGTAWKFQTTIPDDLFSTAFTSESMMSQFLDAVIGAMTDSMTIAINNMSRTAVNNFIAEKIISGSGVVNLLEMYNTAYNTQINAATAMHTKEFYRFASTIIRKYVRYLKEPSTLYNVGDGAGNGVVRATARDNMHVLMLTDFLAGIDAWLLSDSYKDLYDMPLFTEVSYWQGNNDAVNGINSFAGNSSINIVPSSQKSVETAGNRYAINQSGIVCVLADRQAIAVGLNKRRAGSFYNSIDAYSNISSTAMIQYINDMTENGVVFVVADSVATPSITLDKTELTFANSSAADQTVTATTTPEDATVTWKSSKSSVATVSGGVVSAAGAGTCTISAEITVGGVKYTQTVAVTVG